MNTVQLPASGVYTVLVGDCSDTNTGDYDIYTQLTDNPSGTAPLLFGPVQTGLIGSQAQSNTYTFSANAKDEIDFTMVTTNGKLSPKIRLYNPSGTLLSQVWPNYPNYCTTASTVEMDTVQLPTSGDYTVLLGDCSDTNTGNYDIYSQLTDNPSGAATLLFGPTQTGLIGSPAQSNSYIFNGSANEVIDFTMVTTSGSLSPKIRLYNPSGTLLSQVWPNYPNYCTTASTVEMNTVQLPASGDYTVLLGDCSDTNTGNYDVYAQSTNDPFGPAPILWGQVQTGAIGSQAQSNTYTFSGSANNSIDLTMVTTSGSLSPKIRIYNPDGTLLSQAWPNYPNYCTTGATLEMNSIALTQNGDYTVLVGDCSDTNTGNYNLSSQCFGTCPAMPAITWPTPSPIVYGTPLSSTQLNATANVPGSFVYSPAAGAVLNAGPQVLSAIFSPTDTADYSTAKDYVQLTVNTAPTSTSVASSLNPSPLNASVTFTATVTSSGGTPSGTVTFLDGTTTLGTGSLNSGGTATYSTSALTARSHSITAVYAGSTNFSGSTSTALTQIVGALSPTSTSVASSLNPSTFGASVTFTATVTSSAGTPGGTVTFMDGSTTLGTGTLNSGGTATYTTSALAVASHSINAVYAGSTNFSGSTSPALSQTVNPGPTTTSLASSLNPSTFGASVTFTATVTSSAGTPGGTVTFMDGTTTLGTGTLNSGGTATYATSALTGGSHSITAVYAGNSTYSASASPVVTQIVNPASTSTSLTSSLNPSTFGASVTFTATVTSSAGTPSGTVTFEDGSTTLGTGTLSSGGTVTYATSALTGGSHSITAVYAGSTNFSGSTSPALSQTINSPPNPVSFGPQVGGDVGSTVQVPVNIGALNGLEAVDITITFDSTVLSAQPATLGSIVPSGALIESNTTTPGQIIIEMASATGITGPGQLVVLNFNVVSGSPCQTTALTFQNVSFNDGQIPANPVNGSITILPCLQISGGCSYYSNSDPVQGVVLTLSGGDLTAPITTTCDASGNYIFSDVQSASNYRLTASYSNDPSGVITVMDAVTVLKYAAKLITLDHDQLVAGDTNGDGKVDAMDAVNILKYVVGLIQTFPVGNAWAFDPAPPMKFGVTNASVTGSFAGIMKGDVNGAWSPSATQSSPALERKRSSVVERSEDEAPVTLALPAAAYGSPGSIVQIPVTIGEVSDLEGVEIAVQFDPTVLSAQKAVAGSIVPKGAAVVANTKTNTPGQIIVAMASATGITGPGQLLLLDFEVIGNIGQSTALTFQNVSLNAGQISATPTDGAFTVAVKPGAPTGVTATAGSGEATVSFGPPISDGGSAITGYTVISHPGNIQTHVTPGAGSENSVVVQKLKNGTPYTFTVTATNVMGTGPASSASNKVTPGTVPGQPGDVKATAGSIKGTVKVAFKPPASNGGSAITVYTVTSPQDSSLSKTGKASPITITGLTSGNSYQFAVTAANDVGPGAASNLSNAVIPK
jgi:hypothetical protein